MTQATTTMKKAAPAGKPPTFDSYQETYAKAKIDTRAS